MSSRRRNSRRRRRSSTFRTRNAPKLFDYFVVVGMQQTNFNAVTNIEFPPNAKDIGWEPVIQYSYNSNKIVSASTTVTSSSSASSTTSPIPKLQEKYSQIHITKDEITEELQLMEQIKKFSFCDLSDLVNKYNKLSEEDKDRRRYYKILSFKHGLQSERYTFCVTKSSGTRLYGHCRRLFSPDVNLKPSQMPTALVLVSSHRFHSLFDQIMDHIVARWLICHQAIFPILDALILNQPPALGDTFRVAIKSQVHKDDEVLTFKLNSTYHISLKKLFQTLTVDSILWLISCILTERRVIFYCNSLETLSECIHGLLALIYPFRWQHIFVPVLPESLINYLAAPMPFIIGIKSYLAQTKTEFGISEVVLVDLDKQSVRSTKELQDKLKPLPTDPSWKLKRELKRCLKKYPLSMQTHDEYRLKYGNYNPKSFVVPKFSMNVHEQATGWDDLAFYDAFLAFFVLLIGDWRNFYDESNKNVPKPPYHLSSDPNPNNTEINGDDSSNSLRQSTTAASHTPPASDERYDQETNSASVGTDGQTTSVPSDASRNSKLFKISKLAGTVKKVGGYTVKKVGGFASDKIKKKLRDEAKKKDIKKNNKMFYNAECLEYIELLCQSQLFQTWFIRQQTEADDSMKRVSGIQDRYDYIMHNFNRIGASYTGCYKYLRQDSKYRNANNHIHSNLKHVIELAISFTSNRDYSALMQQQQSIQSTLHKLAQEAKTPMGYNAIKNVIVCRLNDCFGKNNHPHGLMALYLLANLMEHSTDRILCDCMNHFVFYAHVLSKYQHEKILIAKQMNKIALQVMKRSTNLEEIKKKKIDKYVAFGDDYEYKYDENKYRHESAKNDANSTFIDDKIAQINFANIYDNKQDQFLLGNYLNSNTNDIATNQFTEVSQFRADNVAQYRERCLLGEVRMIPPFEHLRNEFGQGMPDDLLLKDPDDIMAFFEDDGEGEGDVDDEMEKKIIHGKHASDFALNILNSFSPVCTKPMNTEPRQMGHQVSIFDLGDSVNPSTAIVGSSASVYSNSSYDPNDATPYTTNSRYNSDANQVTPSEDEGTPSEDEGAFLTRTDTKLRDEEIAKDWIRFEDSDRESVNNDNPFRVSSKVESAIDQILFTDNANANVNTNTQEKVSKTQRISRGLGNVLNKVKETGKKVNKKRKGSKPIVIIESPTPNEDNIAETKLKRGHAASKDFDALNFTASRNMNHANGNDSKAKALFADFDFNQDDDNTTPKTNTNVGTSVFADLFGDFTSDTQSSQSNAQQQYGTGSVKNAMQNAYKKPVATKKTGNTDIFQDLF